MVFCPLLVACLVVVGQFNVKRIRAFKAEDIQIDFTGMAITSSTSPISFWTNGSA